MSDGREVDLWLGCDGISRHVKGRLLSDTTDEHGRYKVRITDEEFLEELDWDEPFWDVDASAMASNHHVRYDDYSWSELGEIKPDKEGYLEEIEEPKEYVPIDPAVLLMREHFDEVLGNPPMKEKHPLILVVKKL
jgi:hypothetical protein